MSDDVTRDLIRIDFIYVSDLAYKKICTARLIRTQDRLQYEWMYVFLYNMYKIWIIYLLVRMISTQYIYGMTM